MIAGKLLDLIDVESFVVTSTGTRGEPVGTWQVVNKNVSCQVTTLSGRKLELARELCATATHSLLLRWLPLDINYRFHVTYIAHLPCPDTDMYLYPGSFDDNTTQQITAICMTQLS